nr:RNA-dependent RNA polymerase [Sarcosphaera coronaria partitivirus]
MPAYNNLIAQGIAKDIAHNIFDKSYDSNVIYVGRLNTSNRARIVRHDHNAAGLEEYRRKLILKAMYKFYGADVVEEVKRQRRSENSYPKLLEDYLKNEQPPKKLKKDKHYYRALRVMEDAFRPKKHYLPVAFPDLRYYPWTLNVSAEMPYTTSIRWRHVLMEKHLKGEIDDTRPTFHNLYDEIFINERPNVHLIKEGQAPYFKNGKPTTNWGYTTLHARAHVVGPDDEDKIRAVFGVPKLLLFVENMFIWPMMADLLNRDPKDSPMLWGNEIMKGGWQKLTNLIHNKLGRDGFTTISADWSQFDRRALHSIIDDVHNSWKSFFSWNGFYQPTNFYPNAWSKPERFDNLWNWFTHNVKHLPVADEKGYLYQWTRNGIASGFQQTQLLDSWVNGIMLLTTLSELGINIEADRFFFRLQGDDSLICTESRIFQTYGNRFLDMMSRIALRRFNAKLSTTKSSIQSGLEGCYVLGYYNRYGRAFRTDVDLLSHLLFPEHPQTYEGTASTALGLAMAAQGCSRPFYDTCLDIHNFIVNEMSLKPKAPASLIRKLFYLSGFDLTLGGTRFPSFTETWLQNFVKSGRSESDRQRIWPTNPDHTGGFHFI